MAIFRSKGWATGIRLLNLERDAAFDAKSRIPLPKVIELNPDNPWRPLQEAMDVGQKMSVKQILNLIKVELDRLDDAELTANVKKSIKGQTDTSRIARFLIELKNRKPTKTETTNDEQ